MRKLLLRGFVLFAALLLLAGVFFAHTTQASGETISGSNSFSGLKNVAIPINDIQIDGPDNSTVPVRLFVSNGTLAMSTTTGLTFTGSSTGSKLEFSGSRSDVNTALATLTYTSSNTGADTLEVSLVDAGQVFFPDNGHLYEYVNSTLTWGGAKTAAEARTKYGAQGYLATITSQAENDFVADRLDNAGWMGASDVASEGVWNWVTGPENGTQFWSGAASGSAVGGNYENWNNGEPNDSGSNEDCGQFLSGSSGLWNDLPCSGTTLPGYVVEYGTDATPPSVANHEAIIYTLQSPELDSPVSDTAYSTVSVDTTLYSTPTADSVTLTFTGDVTRVLNLSIASAGNAAFNFDPADPTAAAEVNSASGTIPDGDYTITLSYLDSASGMALSAQSTAVTIDTTPPSIPGTPSTTSPTNDTTPTFSWSASSDDGTGLHATPYAIQWSQDPDFSGFITTSTSSTSYTIPSSLAEGTWYFRARARDAVLNYSNYSASGSATVDTTAPSLETLTPTNNATSFWRSSNLEIALDENVLAGSGSVTIYRLSDDAIVETIDITSEQINIEENVITIDPTTALGFSTQYYVQIDSGALVDAAGNVYAGINNNSTWSFTTEGPDTDADGIPSIIEEAGPNNGDANNDGVVDSHQDTVATFLSSVTGEYVTLAIDAQDCYISSLVSEGEGSMILTDNSFRYPLGLLDFTIGCEVPGATVTVNQYYFNTKSEQYILRKYNPFSRTYGTIADAAISSNKLGDNPFLYVSYDVSDGGARDTDAIANGTIIDPAGLGLAKIVSTGHLVDTGEDQLILVSLAIILVACGLPLFVHITSFKED